MDYKTFGTCSTAIHFNVDKDGILTFLKFDNGCNGNLQGISKLCVGRNIVEIIDLLKGIKCRGNTSCPDQLARALEKYLQDTKN